jgi:hypothetical protein
MTEAECDLVARIEATLDYQDKLASENEAIVADYENQLMLNEQDYFKAEVELDVLNEKLRVVRLVALCKTPSRRFVC